MKMHLFMLFCLLGVLSAQEVTELTSCLTKNQNLRMDCKYTLEDTSKTPTCEFQQEGKVMGSTDPDAKPEPTFKNRVNVTLLDDNICRLSMTGLSDDKARNNTCIIKLQTASANKTAVVQKSKLLTCSAISMFQTGPVMLLTLTLLPVLMEIWHL